MGRGLLSHTNVMIAYSNLLGFTGTIIEATPTAVAIGATDILTKTSLLSTAFPAIIATNQEPGS